MNKCTSCKNNKNNNNSRKFSKKQSKPHFNKNNNTIFPNNMKPKLKGLKESFPSKSNQEMTLNLGKSKANRFIIYYGSTKKDLDNYNQVLNSKNAYGDFKNHGIAKTDTTGKALLKFRCPQVYKEDGNTVLPHIHYILSNKGNTKWIEKLETQHLVCDVSHQELKKLIENGKALVLNALPIEYYIKDRIPMSVPLPHDLVLNKLSPEEVKEYIKSTMPHAMMVYKAFIKNKLKLMDIPIVSYCYDSGCDADADLQQKLIKIGFKNVKLYTPGIIGFRKLEK